MQLFSLLPSAICLLSLLLLTQITRHTMSKEEQIAQLKLKLHNTVATIKAQYKNASLVERCDLIKARIDAIQEYAAAVSAIFQGRA
jgi:hypothetical protein